jgi:hypothetical protein
MHRTLPIATFVFISILASACTPLDIEQESKQVTGERLLASPPPGWIRVFQMNKEKTRFSDFVPQGEDADNWSTRLSIESHATEDLSVDPITLLLSEAEQDEARCNFVQHFNIFSGLENHYETSVRLFLCGENAFTGKGEIKLVKAIRAEAFFYSVRITRRLPVFDVNQPEFANDEIATWSTFLKTISVCDGTREHPCTNDGTANDSSHEN